MSGVHRRMAVALAWVAGDVVFAGCGLLAACLAQLVDAAVCVVAGVAACGLCLYDAAARDVPRLRVAWRDCLDDYRCTDVFCPHHRGR